MDRIEALGRDAIVVDGNARPIFVRGRIVALMGYELVEGTLAADRISERRRVSFAPSTVTSRRRAGSVGG